MTTATRIQWVEQSREFWRSGRFDVFRAADSGRWVTVDFERAKTKRFDSLGDAMRWCEGRDGYARGWAK